MRNILIALAALLSFTSAFAQGPSGPGPGPGTPPSPWAVNGNTISYPGAVLSPSGVPGGSKGPGTYNVTGGYYVNGVKVDGLPPTTMANGMICNPTGAPAVPIACTWNTFASGAIGAVANSLPFYSGGAWGRATAVKSVLSPGTGTLESALPPQTITGASKTFGTADLFMLTRRSNGGASMTDIFPGTTTAGMVGGTRIVYDNVDATASVTITAGPGTTMSSGSGTDVIGPGRSVAYVYDAAATQWRVVYNTKVALLGPNNLSDLASVPAARTNLGLGTAALQNIGTTGANVPILNVANTWGATQTFPNGSVPNNTLANSTVTINGQTVALGGSITITAAAAAITYGSTVINSGAGIMWNASNGSTLAAISLINNSVITVNGTGTPLASTSLPSGLTIPSPLGIVKGDVGLGNVANVDTTNAANITSGTLPAARLPAPTASTLGGVQASNCATNNWVNGLNTSGALICNQPGFGNLSGSISAGQIPNSTITNAMLANVPANQLLANVTGAAAAAQYVAGAAARTPALLNIDQITTNGNTNVTIAANVRTMVTSANLTAARTWTLPAASSVNPGQPVVILDQAGGINGSNFITVAAAGSDTINGVGNIAITAQYGGMMAWSDGVSKWTSLATGGGGGSAGVTSIGGATGVITLATGLTQSGNVITPAFQTAGTGITLSGGAAAVNVATKAQQQAGSSVADFVTPGRQQEHPSAVKAWAVVTISGGVGTLTSGYRVSGTITKNATGDFSITFSDTFIGSPSCVWNVGPTNDSGLNAMTVVNFSTGTGASRARFMMGGSLTDPSAFSVHCTGSF